ncbi:saccharopine dehydrogenase C-terminal domain-containing protein [Glycomyces xiaoerkulensis]|uniref:saccharopine dehydrogenase C-terminal domain-containing protein n=1 Tax=Glycomyces xiaoerkulensis TaxID=2038139 RepID=UPI000C259B95|nr:saccharopine dehydrogenase C-terminal domain-containing protein [Glycomyces xiaoerkulensis]
MLDAPLAAPSGTVHWLGTGLSTARAGIERLHQEADLVVWGRTRARAERRLAELGVTAPVRIRGLDEGLAERVGPGDVVVSMLAPAMHADLLRVAMAAGAHFACTSYTSAEVAALAPAAASRGLAVVTETGLDPGIDHLLTAILVGRLRDRLGAEPERATLRSHCGGVPAEPGEFKYRFSWAPVGVLRALGQPATYVRDGDDVTVARPWEAVEPYRLNGECFEAYPNRDSRPFIAQYGLDRGAVGTFVRGTLRPEGWSEAWAEVFEVVASGDERRLVDLAEELQARYPTTPDDRDRVVMAVDLALGADERDLDARATLDLTGDDADTAMARCVSLPLVCALTDLVEGVTAPGLHRATEDAATAERWITRLGSWGVPVALPA